jgi:hypothetical protein
VHKYFLAVYSTWSKTGLPLLDADIELNLFELKEKAKWSRDTQERKLAISGMLSHGANALASLEEIFNVSAYEDIRAACLDAIRSITGRSNAIGIGRPMELQVSDDRETTTTQPLSIAAENVKKKQPRDTEDAGLVASDKLADLPP